MSNKVRRPSRRNNRSAVRWLAALMLLLLLLFCGIAYTRVTRDDPLPRVRGGVLMYTGGKHNQDFPAASTVRIFEEYSDNPLIEMIPSFNLPRGASARYALLLRGDAKLEPETIQEEPSDRLTISGRRVNSQPRLRSMDGPSDLEGSTSDTEVQVITGTVYGPSEISNADLRSSTVGLAASTNPVIRGRSKV